MVADVAIAGYSYPNAPLFMEQLKQSLSLPKVVRSFRSAE
ncbi:hypothetical protein TRICHSKD4_2970 [Roseibium sp. TrichSKD4]|nr:hypothetical protein TRICHSKD4_2970 [Roseibium sp. TrichSKD4]